MMPHDPKASFNAESAARHDEHLRGDEEIASQHSGCVPLLC